MTKKISSQKLAAKPKSKRIGKIQDKEFNYVLKLDANLDPWRTLAAEWYEQQERSLDHKRAVLDCFLSNYIHGLGLEKNPWNFLRRTYNAPSFMEILSLNETTAISYNNHLREFLGWVLVNKLSVEDDNGYQVVPAEYNNPISKICSSSRTLSESPRIPLPFKYIKELRTLLRQGPDFKDWKWAQNSIVSDWFAIEQHKIYEFDPDCVWRKKTIRTRGKNHEIFEIWSPVRVVALYLKLLLPLRTHQIRMLDSGEGDTRVYQKGGWVTNPRGATPSSSKKQVQRGVFRKIVNPDSPPMVGLYINTNKTADIGKDGKDFGYVIPWQHDEAIYWLEKLRNWQIRYNKVSEPVPWTRLKNKHLGTSVSKSILELRGSNYFLFRHAATNVIEEKCMPIFSISLEPVWYKLLYELECRCIARNETMYGGERIRFVYMDTVKRTLFPLHSLRVSLITAYALEGGVPMEILSKMIAGHSNLIMTLHYTKAGIAHVSDLMDAAEKKILESEQETFRRFLTDATYRQIVSRSAVNDYSSINLISSCLSAASLVIGDAGICPMASAGCSSGGIPMKELHNCQNNGDYAAVPGYPAERNCIRCRWFITGPAFLPGLLAYSNMIIYKIGDCSARYGNLEHQVKEMENRRYECEVKGIPFADSEEYSKLHHIYEQEAELIDKLANDLNAITRLMNRCIRILNKHSGKDDKLKLTPVGSIEDVRVAFKETKSEMHQLEIMCQNAIMFPAIDSIRVSLRRSQVLDAMLTINGGSPVFFKLSEKQQLLVGNEVMNLIRARTGSLEGAVEVAEGTVLLHEIGLLETTLELIEESLPMNNVIGQQHAVSNSTISGYLSQEGGK